MSTILRALQRVEGEKSGEGEIWMNGAQPPTLGTIISGTLLMASESFPRFAPLTLTLTGAADPAAWPLPDRRPALRTQLFRCGHGKAHHPVQLAIPNTSHVHGIATPAGARGG